MNEDRARALRKNVRYPAYQLVASAKKTSDTAESQMVLGVLHVLAWARTKFQKFEIPDSLKAPGPQDYQKVSLKDLAPVYINEGYSVESVCLPDQKLWAFRLTEPDLSVTWKNGNRISTAVPGRIFETNAAFAVSGSLVRFAVRIVISEPEGVEAPGRVFCPDFVRRLANDGNFGLVCGYPVQKQMFELRSADQIKNLKDYLKDGLLPAVVFCDVAQKMPLRHETPCEPIKAGLSNPLTRPTPGDVHTMLRMMAQVKTQMQVDMQPQESGALEDFLEKGKLFARSRMGYAHAFHLPTAQVERFTRTFGITTEGNCAVFLEPKQFGGDVHIFSVGKSEDDFSRLMDMSSDYLRGRDVVIDRVSFLNDAKLLLAEERKKAAHNIDELAAAYDEKICLLQSDHTAELLKKNDTIDQLERKIHRLTEELAAKDAQIVALKEEYEKNLEKSNKREKSLSVRNQYLESLSDRPRSVRDINEWVKEKFTGRMILHPRAQKELQSLPTNAVDLQLLCDALEYLASEYRDSRAGILSPEAANDSCRQKYNRPFDVVRCGKTATEMFPNEYKVKYGNSKKNEEQMATLDWHLKVGNTTENLIRIYFLYDEGNKLIVVGSLPRHLSIPSIQA